MTNAIRDRVADLVPKVREEAARTEAEGAVPTEVLTALMDLGALSLRIDDEAKQSRELLDAVHDLAGACGSTGWLVAHAGASAWLLELCSEPARDALTSATGADPVVAFSLEPAGILVEDGDGYRLSGRWSDVTGAAYAGWLLLSAHRLGRPPGLALVPISECRVSPGIDSVGLGAAGALDVEVDQLHLPPESLCVLSGDLRPGGLSAIGRLAAMAVVGSARGALERHIEQVREGVGRSHGGQEVRVGDPSPSMVGRAASQLDAATLLLSEGCADDTDAVPQDHWEHQIYAINRAVQATGLVFSSGRRHALAYDDPVARLWRDVRVGAQQAKRLTAGLRMLDS